MEQLKTALIKDNMIIPCYYYEIEQICIELIKEYCNLSDENQVEFLNFSKNYNTFKPYFDFVVCKLGYKVLNPELKLNGFLYGKDNHMYFSSDSNNNPECFCYGLSDDKTLNIHPMSLDSSTFQDCLIDWNGNYLLPSDMFGHVHILQQILNLLLISNKKICEDYINYKSDIGFFVQRYLPLIRFQAEKQGRSILTKMVIRKSTITDKQIDFINYLISNRYTYNSCILDCEFVDQYDDACNISDDLKYNQHIEKKAKNY